MISAWTKHLSGEEKKRFQNEVLGSKQVLIRLQTILNEMRDEKEDLELSTDSYNSPNWDYKQADTNGYKRCLKQISKLIKLDDNQA